VHTGSRCTGLTRRERQLIGVAGLLITAGAVAGFIYGWFYLASQAPAWVFVIGGAIAGGATLPRDRICD
jgi:hypothetical protein